MCINRVNNFVQVRQLGVVCMIALICYNEFCMYTKYTNANYDYNVNMLS